MFRSVLGWVLALVGATAAVLSPFRAWYDGRLGREYRIGDLFSGITESKAGLVGSILLPFAFAALVALVGLLLRSRLTVALAGVVVLGFTVFWMVRVGQAQGSLAVNNDGTGLNVGVAYALTGGALLLLAAAAMLGRGQRRRHRVDGNKHRRREPVPREEHEPVPEEEEPFPRYPPPRGGGYGRDGRDDRPGPSPYHP
ncbi:hypothetical protein [Streptomyces sp. ISL-100]|uniref:hypothetical protein n=1 Tax=Streptomyces sp. ISL-100 TaxID=2819173 RepID=UPI001BE74B01|nr:hypothetical protein [Streptomyces sp. ISL-100]MBT2398949.1 hypothetical protein [Streptomyces sp. ISL-100]